MYVEACVYLCVCVFAKVSGRPVRVVILHFTVLPFLPVPSIFFVFLAFRPVLKGRCLGSLDWITLYWIVLGGHVHVHVRESEGGKSNSVKKKKELVLTIPFVCVSFFLSLAQLFFYALVYFLLPYGYAR